MIERRVAIGGMSCHHCVMAVQNELAKIPALEVKEVSIGSALVRFDEHAVGLEKIRAAVEEAGYTMEG